MESFFVERPDCRLYCEKRGSGPLMLMVHGVAADADYFAKTADFLAKKYTVVTYDRRGYTRSTAPENADYSYPAQAEDAACVIRAMQMGPAIIVGSSAGGVVASAAALSAPELVRCMILHEPVCAKDKETGEEWKDLMDQVRACREAHRISKAMMAFIRSMGGIDKRSKKRPLSAQAQDLKNMEVFVHYEVDSMLILSIEKAAEISCPVTILAGECDETGLFHRAAVSAARTIGWPLLTVPGYHNLAQDLPQEFAVQIAGVLALDDSLH